MSTALQIHSEAMAEWKVMIEQAATLVKTGFLPPAIKTPEQALAIILTGRELGVGMMAALNNINVIAGKPTISPQLMLALINRTGQLEGVTIDDDGQECLVTMKRQGRTAHSEAFSMADAARMKTTEYINGEKKTISLSEKYNWRQMPAVMRKWRAIAACARVVFPDVILGMYTPEEMGAANLDAETGEVIEVAAEPPKVEVCHDNYEPSVEPIESEPVRSVKLEGAQPKPQQANSGNTRAILALAGFLGWSNEYLADEIHARFRVAVEPENIAVGLDSLPTQQAKKILQALQAEKAAHV